jgi:hypothetical protein
MMRRSGAWILVAFSGAAVAAGSGLKAGLWEITQVKQVVDGKDMGEEMATRQSQMQQALAAMPADQRKQMEARLAQRGFSLTGKNGAGNRVCVSAQMAARDKPLIDPQGQCQPSKVDRAGSKTTFEFNCSNEGRTMSGKGESTVGDGTLVTSMDMTANDAEGGSHKVHSETQMKYLGPDCQGVKPADEIAREVQSPAGK